MGGQHAGGTPHRSQAQNHQATTEPAIVLAVGHAFSLKALPSSQPDGAGGKNPRRSGSWQGLDPALAHLQRLSLNAQQGRPDESARKQAFRDARAAFQRQQDQRRRQGADGRRVRIG